MTHGVPWHPGERREDMRKQPELKVEEAPTGSLVPYANNAKTHTGEQIDQICSSIEEFGFNDPVGVWDGPEGLQIVEGHGRVMAAGKLGLATVPVVRLNHLSDEQRRAYALAHNKLTMNTGWDFEALDAELGALDIDMGEFGFPEHSPSGAGGSSSAAEIDVSEFDDGKFENECPRCGFRF